MKIHFSKSVVALTGGVILFASCAGGGSKSVNDLPIEVTRASTLFVELPDGCPTPDGMAIDSAGYLILACPNFADPSKTASLMRITQDGKIEKWIEVPVLAETGVACPMGIDFNDRGDLYVCDNQGWSGSEAGQNRGRLLKLIFGADGTLAETVTIASGMEHPNGVKVRDGKVYVTQSLLSPLCASGQTVSGVYRFDEGERDIIVRNDSTDRNLLLTVVTENPDVKYGLDGLAFDRSGNLYLGNFGDAAIVKVTFDGDGNVSGHSVWAQDTTQMSSVDGICFDPATGILYAADFSANAIAAVSSDGVVTRIARSPDCDGSDGGLDQPGEPIVWGNRLIVSCFDAVTGPDKVNSGHDKPYTLAQISLGE
ncbi:MAG: phage head-tail adapter protein [Bacteroides sp.]|nr:phage head-tail adapter protein [Bacteroides sp.]